MPVNDLSRVHLEYLIKVGGTVFIAGYANAHRVRAVRHGPSELSDMRVKQDSVVIFASDRGLHGGKECSFAKQLGTFCNPTLGSVCAEDMIKRK